MRIREIEAENFKLFTTNFHEVNEIEKSDLVVFNGPNGYGKTSVFDIIEFCLTGTISGNYGIEEISISLQGLCRVLVRNFQSSRDRAKNASGII